MDKEVPEYKLDQGTLTEREASVQMTSLYKLVFIQKIVFTFLQNKFNEEVHCTEPSALVSIWS